MGSGYGLSSLIRNLEYQIKDLQNKVDDLEKTIENLQNDKDITYK